MLTIPTDVEDLQRTNPNNKIVIKDGATVLENGVQITVATGGPTKTLSVQKVDNNDSNVPAGAPAESVSLVPTGVLTLNTYGGLLNSAGKFDFVVGPFNTGDKGCVSILVWNDGGEGLGHRTVTIVVGS